MGTDAKDVFVFVGAGASRSMPSGLPMFDRIRDWILDDLGLGREEAGGLAPEPFFSALSQGGIDIESWLRDALDVPAANAAHVALAQLAHAGAAIWTVNFDRGIEMAAGHSLRVAAWPVRPTADAQLLKPHGSVPGRLIVTSDRVLLGLEEAWLTRLRADLAGKQHVMFLGYSGRDLDFQPLWDEILEAVPLITWWDLPELHDAHRQLLPRAARSRRLELPVLTEKGGGQNPSFDFVEWCRSESLASIPDELVQQLWDRPPEPRYPALGDTALARSEIQQLQGDLRGARRSLRRLVWRGPGRVRAARSFVRLTINHGGRNVAFLLRTADLLPPVGRARRWRAAARGKRVNIRFITGDHSAVLHATKYLTPGSPSTLLLLRCGSLRMTGSLDEAARLGELANARARSEGHPARTANAAYQWTMALMWAYRLDEARQCLDEHLRPEASIADNRWIAWALFVQAALAIHGNEPAAALDALAAAQTRFASEQLLDGVVSVSTVRLAALRQLPDQSAWQSEHSALARSLSNPDPEGVYYAKRHPFSREALALEEGEYERLHTRDLDAAAAAYGLAAESRYPVHASLGHLGLALIGATRHQPPDHARRAFEIAQGINARYVILRTRVLIDATGEELERAIQTETFIP